MHVDIKIIQKGTEENYTNCSLHQNKDADEIALLIAASKVSGKKYLYTLNKERVNRIINEYKINIDNFEIVKIQYLDDITLSIIEFNNASIFIFNYYKLRLNPDFFWPELYTDIDYESKLILAESDQNDFKIDMLKLSTTNNLTFFIAEYEEPISIQIQNESGKYYLISFVNGKKQKKECFARPLDIEYSRGTVQVRSNNKILEKAVNSSNEILIIYPALEEEELWTYETMNPSLDFKKSKELNFLCKYIFYYLGSKNLANEKVKYPNPIDENGNPIPDNLLTEYDSKLAEDGLKRHIPNKDEVEMQNSLKAIKQYIENGDSSLLLNDNIVGEIDKTMKEKIESNKVEFLAVPKNIFELKRSILNRTGNKDIFVLGFNQFAGFEFSSMMEFEEYEELMLWIRYNKRNFIYSEIDEFRL
jgi:hypothetical protein